MNPIENFKLVGDLPSTTMFQEERDESSMGRFFDRKALKKRKPSVSEENRPTTPTESIKKIFVQFKEIYL